MAWNEPGGSPRDPWGKRNTNNSNDVDAIFRKLSDFFGGKGGGNDENRMYMIILAVVFALWFLFGFFVVDETQRAVIKQFGRHVDTVGSGPHWVPLFVQSREIIDVSSYRTMKNTARMLTKDENIVNVEYEVQFNISDPADFLFNLKDPESTLSQASESAIREIVGKNTLDYVIKESRQDIAQRTQVLLQEIMDRYKSGVNVIKVNMTRAEAPEEVQASFEDVNKAREDKERFLSEAEAYRNKVIPVARGGAEQYIEEARGYKARIVNSAQGETSRFLKLLAEYEKAPKVTRERLYIEAVEEVLSKSSKVMVDVKGSGNMMYLPLDQILKNKNATPDNATRAGNFNSNTGAASKQSGVSGVSAQDGRDDPRSRDFP
ncbi:MAG: FtsH protease activity modulator HflK [Gammaproteobacteria bacterium]|nr:FtsH protease activity modulator HflK [Gammaproteobacteria bacterium]